MNKAAPLEVAHCLSIYSFFIQGSVGPWTGLLLEAAASAFLQAHSNPKTAVRVGNKVVSSQRPWGVRVSKAADA